MFNYCSPKILQELKSETSSDGKRYYTVSDDEKYPSVTTVIGARKKEAIMEWRKRVGEAEANRISSKAAKRGTGVHKICENYLNNEKDYYANAMPDAKEMFVAIRPFLDRINNIHYQEQTLWSKTLKLAGRVDCIAEYDGTLSVIDFKTSKKIKEHEDIEDYFWQTCAYSLMYEELIGKSVDQLVIILAVDNSKPLIFKEKTENHIDGLVRAIDFYNKINSV